MGASARRTSKVAKQKNKRIKLQSKAPPTVKFDETTEITHVHRVF